MFRSATLLTLFLVSLVGVWLFSQRSPSSSTSPSPQSQPALSASAVEEFRKRNQLAEFSPSVENMLVARWAAISLIASPLTDPQDPEIRRFNEAAVGATLMEALRSENSAPRLGKLDKPMAQAVVMSAVAVTPVIAAQGRNRVTELTAPQVLTGIACFVVLSLEIAAETGLDDTDMAVARTTIDVAASDNSLELTTQFVSGNRTWLWPERWARFVKASLQKPLVVLKQDAARQALADWIDRNPQLRVIDAAGQVMYTTTLQSP